MQINHYLNFHGTAEVAFQFYQTVFGGEFSSLVRYGDTENEQTQSLSESEKNAIMHISLPLTEHSVLMASDVIEGFCGNHYQFIQGTNHYISVNLEAHQQIEAQRIFNALSVNSVVETELEMTFWGALYGALTDQFGVQWMINCQLTEA